MRSDPALRAPVRRPADRRARRRPCRHSHRRQRGGDGRRSRDRRPVLSPVRRSVDLCARPRAGDWPRSGDDAAPQAQRHASGCVLARPGEAIRGALSRSRPACRMTDLKAARGVIVSARGLEAALVLPNADSASLCVYEGNREIARAPMTRDADGVLRGLAPGFGAGARYGFRVEGPYEPQRGRRFDPSKLLADPYAWRFDRPFRLHPSMFAFGEDTGPHTAKAIAGRAACRGAWPQAHRARGAHHLRAQPARLLPPQSSDPRGRARNLRGARASRLDRASHRARRHRDRDHARGPVRRRPAHAPARPVGRMGL